MIYYKKKIFRRCEWKKINLDMLEENGTQNADIRFFKNERKVLMTFKGKYNFDYFLYAF